MALFDDLLTQRKTVADWLAEAEIRPDYIRRDRAFSSRWAWDDGDTVVATVWREEIENLHEPVHVEYENPLRRSGLDAHRKARATEQFEILSQAAGRPIRVIIQTRVEDRIDANAGVARRRGLDPMPWYSYVGGDTVVLTRHAVQSEATDNDGDGWTDDEIRTSVQTYLEMHEKVRNNEPFVKKHYYAELAHRFGRSAGAFEYRMQNISYVLSLHGRSWVPGLKPAKNVGANVAAKIERFIAEIEGQSAVPVAEFEIEVREAKKRVRTRPQGRQCPESKSVVVTQYVRDPAVVAWVLAEAKGICECCLELAPFQTTDGPYLEVHHVRRLADRGSDMTSNAIAICPNCHRRIHYGIDATNLLEQLYQRISRLIRE